jgi:hypothetical protein
MVVLLVVRGQVPVEIWLSRIKHGGRFVVHMCIKDMTQVRRTYTSESIDLALEGGRVPATRVTQLPASIATPPHARAQLRELNEKHARLELKYRQLETVHKISLNPEHREMGRHLFEHLATCQILANAKDVGGRLCVCWGWRGAWRVCCCSASLVIDDAYQIWERQLAL